MASETVYVLPDGGSVRVVDRATASEYLNAARSRAPDGRIEPLIFGDAGKPEGIVVPWEEWERLVCAEAGGSAYEVARDG